MIKSFCFDYPFDLADFYGKIMGASLEFARFYFETMEEAGFVETAVDEADKAAGVPRPKREIRRLEFRWQSYGGPHGAHPPITLQP